MITIPLLLLQLYILFILVSGLVKVSAPILTLFSALAIIAIIVIINSDDNPAFKMAWIIPICVFPLFGVALYLFVTTNPGSRGLAKHLARRVDESSYLMKTEYRVLEKIKKEPSGFRNITHYLQHNNLMPAYDHTKVTFFPLGENKYEDLLRELRKAEHFIFLEYFIVHRGVVWNSILEILKEKAAQGVEVRLLYDGMNTLSALPTNYPKKLQAAGIKTRVFGPIRPLLSTAQNNRDHRKILVIDGRIAYNGGINLADEYMNLEERFGHWKDTAVKLEGEAVRSFTIMFLQMWYLQDKGKGEYERYLLPQGSFPGGPDRSGYVIPYNDDPMNHLDIAKDVYLDLLYKARSYVHIMTPYLVPDNEMVNALCYAARRGVDVRILLPHIPDKKMVFSIARTFYPVLLESGVKIYEYTPGFVHAKEFISDDTKAVVGSINLDFRSLYLHFECATLILNNPVVPKIERDFQETLKKSRKVNLQYYVDLPLFYRLFGKVANLFAPLV
ncbi:MAG: cardiolipin synthase [Lachnospiraceae bacterium]|nr:cardiolipin synthase [Lachnospiraceae bacterium]